MKYTQNSQHKTLRVVDYILFFPKQTMVVCSDGERYGVGTVDCDRPPKPLTFDLYAELYFEELHGEHKDYLN